MSYDSFYNESDVFFLSIFDTAASRLNIECSEPQNLSSRYTSIAWGSLNTVY